MRPAKWSCDTGQQILCFDRCHLSITWMSNIKEGCYKNKAACLCQPISSSMATILHESIVITVAIIVTIFTITASHDNHDKINSGFPIWGCRIPACGFLGHQALLTNHFSVVCLVTWPLNGSEAGGDLALIQTSPIVLCKCI